MTEPERQVRLRLLTERGWVDGTVRLPSPVRLVDWLNHTGHFLTLTDVSIGASALRYLSVRKSAVRAVVPPADEAMASFSTGGTPAAHEVWCLLADGAVRGRLEVPAPTRVSDFLAHHGGFVGLRAAQLHRRDETGVAEVVEATSIVVRLDAVLGLAET